MGIVDLSVRMRPVSHVGLGHYGSPAIRLQPIKPGSIPDIPVSHTWVWAIVQLRAGEPDALLVGGSADSQTAATDQARDAFKRFELRWAESSGRA
jgi:hypothetical protein